MPLDPNAVNLHPQAKLFLDFLAQAHRIPYCEITPEQARAQFTEFCQRMKKQCEWDVEASDHTIPGPAGPVPTRLFRPRAAGSALLPVLIYFHGGGWCIGDIETHDAVCRQLSDSAGCAVLAVDYRLAPEHPFPAGLDDCFATVQWVARDGASLGLDPLRIAVGGDSAGGNLAAVCAIMARDADIVLRAQILIYPATDFVRAHPSHEECAEGFLLTRESMDWFSGNYVDPCDHRDWRASPLHAPDHARLAPAMVIVGEFDPLRDESRAYAERLKAAGTEASFHLYPGMIHAFINLGGLISVADDAMGRVAEMLTEKFSA
ncbi:MAG TPA: alpha/beta hydrolase [Stellaceae bacterium]|nr:alpha/beta hydrolase [Stellaceae bacterium]